MKKKKAGRRNLILNVAKAIKYFILVCIINFCQFNSIAQDRTVDSLQLLFKNAKHDTIKLNLLVLIIESISDDNVWPKYNQQALKLSEKLSRSENEIIKLRGKKGLSDALNNIGYTNIVQGNVIKALDCFARCVKIDEEIGNKKGTASTLNNVAAIYTNQGDIPKAIDSYARSLKIMEEVGDSVGIAVSLHNLALIYKNQGDLKKAFLYYIRSLKIRENIGDKQGIGTSLNNIGSLYEQLKDTVKALEYYTRSLKIQEEINDGMGIANSLRNIGKIYDIQCKTKEALECYKRSLTLTEEMGDKKGTAIALLHIGMTYFRSPMPGTVYKQNNYPLAHTYFANSLTLAKQMGFPKEIRNAEIALTKVDSAMGNYNSAFTHYKQFIIYRDSLHNEDTRRASIKSQLKYEFEKKEAVIVEQQQKEQTVAEEKSRRQQIVIWLVAGGFLIVILFAGFIFRTLSTTRFQKTIIEEKQKEILDSIYYAKRIQQSLLPTDKYIDKILSGPKAVDSRQKYRA